VWQNKERKKDEEEKITKKKITDYKQRERKKGKTCANCLRKIWKT
jgi:hypothetical protein